MEESTRADKSKDGNNKTSLLRSRRWCFTCNNYTAEQIRAIREQGAKNKFMVFGFEVGEQGTPHIQGYCEFKNDTSLSLLRKTWPLGIHWEKAKGSKQQNITYCTKEGKHEITEQLPLTEEQIRQKLINDEINRQKQFELEFRERQRLHEKYKDGFNNIENDEIEYNTYIENCKKDKDRLYRLFGNYLN